MIISKQTPSRTRHTKATKKPILRLGNRKWIGRALGGIVAITYIAALYVAITTNLLPPKYAALIVSASALIVAGTVFADLKSNWRAIGKSIALVLVSLLVVLANGYAYSVSKSTNDFLVNVQGNQYTSESYSIVTKRDYPVTLQHNNAIGYLADDPNNTLVLKTTQARTNAGPHPSAELASLTLALDDRTVDTLVLRSSLLPLLGENYPSFYQGLKVLDRFSVKVASHTKKTDITKPYAIFIGGIDTYGEIKSVSRSDVNIVAVINPRTHKVLLVNTPRDYYVQLHGTSGIRDKLTHAGIYGIDMSRQTLEDLYNVPIEYDVRVNFTSLLSIIDAIGGVSVYSDNAFTSWKYTFVQGYNQLDSKQALEFSRNRKAFADGDRTRGKNQQRVIEAIINKLNNPNQLLKYQAITRSLGDSFQTNASKDEIAALLKQQMNTLGGWKVESVSAEGADSSNVTYSGGSMQLYVMEPNSDSLSTVRAKIQTYIR